MIASISGKISAKVGDRVVVEVGGLGYEIFVTTADQTRAKVGDQARYEVYEQLREDAHNLYGFTNAAAKELFVNLLSVNGVGPKVALAILSATSLEHLRQAIGSGDPELLKGVSGVGKKTAERIVMELRGKVTAEGITSSAASSDGAYQALIGLGYTAAQAAEAVAKIPATVTGDSARVKAALQEIGR